MESKNVCFAYFGDGKFLGWYSDTFGSITKNGPKIYTNSEKQIEIIESNFNYQISKLKIKSELATTTGHNGLSLLDDGLNSTRKDLNQYDNLELRIVDCPFYDGPNPEFDKVEYDLLKEGRKQKMTEEGIFDIPAPSIERSNAVNAFDEKYGKIPCDNWIYVDYKLVKEWASNEPTEFLKVLTPSK